ncbi:MAG TPA: alpha/beta hydrolase-fold protein, partial [Bryobacteraceae bacterium]|nr:alpha/beta hydrolase-fold protein [Bryobacteraceae bacterium]
PAFVPGAPQTPEVARANREAQQKFVDELLKYVVPNVEKNYRVLTTRENRAIAGLSMGAGQTLAVAPTHLDQFAWIGVWSGGVNPPQEADFLSRNAAFFENPEKTNKQVKLLWVGVGSNDTLAGAGTKNLARILQEKGIRHEFHESEGGHTWINWRHYLNDYSQLLFQ